MVKYLEKARRTIPLSARKVVNVEFDMQRAGSQAGKAYRSSAGRQGRHHRPDGERSGVHHQRRLRGELLHGQPERAAQPSTRRSSPAAAGTCGAKSPRRILPSVIPDKFCRDPEQTNWMSATVTTLDQQIIPYIKNICKRDPFTGKVVTGGIVTVKDSSWLLSWTINRQPQFRNQPKDQLPGVGLRPVHRQARRLREEAHAGVHRQGNLHGVAVPHRRAGGRDRGHGREQRQHRARA